MSEPNSIDYAQPEQSYNLVDALAQLDGKASADSAKMTLFIFKALVQRFKLDEDLAKLGYRQFMPLAVGTGGLVLKTTDGQVIRLSKLRPGQIETRANALEELQAIQRYKFGDIQVEVMPQLAWEPPVEAPYASHQAFIEHLKARKYSGDMVNRYALDKDDSSDTAYLPDGTPLCVDPDGLAQNDGYNYNPELDKQWVVEVPGKKSALFPYLPEGIISKQEHFFPALVDKRVRGILTDGDKETLQIEGGLEKLRLEKPECFQGITQDNLPTFMKLVFEENLYPSQAIAQMKAQNIIKEAPGGAVTLPIGAHAYMLQHSSDLAL